MTSTTFKARLAASLSLMMLVAAITMIVTACTGGVENASLPPDSETLASPTADSETVTNPTADSETPDNQTVDEALNLLDEAYSRIDGAWEGFDASSHPVVLAWKNGDDLLVAVAINHPDPEALGRAQQVDHGGSSLGSVHMLTDLEPEVADRLSDLVNFEFDTEIGGASSFLMEADTDDDFFDPTTLDYGSTLLHEMFHRYQGLNPDIYSGEGFQDVDGYAYTADNIKMAALEDRALLAALAADNNDDRTTAARHVAAIRAARLQSDARVILDQDQELVEGAARYIEHLLGGDDTAYSYHNGNFDRELVPSPTEAYEVKDNYGFGRFYSTGAAMYRLLDLLGHKPDVLTEQSGRPPAELLAETLGVTDADVAELVAEAQSVYDAENELAALAAEAAETAATEPSPFAEDEGDSGYVGADDSEADGDYIEITDEQAECLDRELGPTDGDSGDGGGSSDGETIPEDVWELCVGAG